MAHIARHVAMTDDEAALEAIFVEDLYVAAACAEGDPAALTTFERTLLPRVAPYVARVDAAPDFVSDVLQTVRVRLLMVREGKPPSIGDYGGRAPLAAWLRVAAVRAAQTLANQDARYVTLGTDMGDAQPGGRSSPPLDPEMGFLKEEAAAEVNRALERTLADLGDRDRALLRLYFVEGMSLAALGRVYHVHESTMMRRVHALRDRLLAEVKSELGVDSEDLASRLALVASRLDVHLGHHLRDAK